MPRTRSSASASASSGGSSSAAAAPRRRPASSSGSARKQPAIDAPDVEPSSSATAAEEGVETSALLSMLPTECLVEVLANFDIHELLQVAWTCKRVRDAACDEALWAYTRFSVENWYATLQRHFAPDLSRRHDDHTGRWTRCVCVLTGGSLMCREVELDYVDRGEGVCYRLLRSVSCLQQLHHPNIVPLVLINLEPQRNGLRLFYEDAGVPLEEQLKHGKLSLPHAREVLRQVLSALAHCHCQGITHRNLKPKYVLLRHPHGDTSRWAVKLSDFNSVRWLGIQRAGQEEPLYGAKEVAGACSPTVVTQPYRAPEILLGCQQYTTAIDIWACGCVFAEMCSGEILFAGDSDIGQLFKIFALLGTPGPAKPVEWEVSATATRPAEWGTCPPSGHLPAQPIRRAYPPSLSTEPARRATGRGSPLTLPCDRSPRVPGCRGAAVLAGRVPRDEAEDAAR